MVTKMKAKNIKLKKINLNFKVIKPNILNQAEIYVSGKHLRFNFIRYLAYNNKNKDKNRQKQTKSQYKSRQKHQNFERYVSQTKKHNLQNKNN